MNTACPSSLYTTSIYNQAAKDAFTRKTFLSSANPPVLTIPTYSPSGAPLPVTVRGESYTANLMSITDMIVLPIVSGRYSLPSTGYWAAANSADLTSANLSAIYTSLTTNTIAGKTRKIIDPNLAAPVGGQVTTATESVSYDLLYSIQYEFCFYAKVYETLMRDYITVQNKVVPTDIQQTVKDSLIRDIVNNMNAAKLRLNDIIKIAGYIGTTQTGKLSELTDKTNQFVSSMSASISTLNANQSVLFSKDKESSLRSRQMEFSEEKNAYANQLLAMYGFANLIALGLLFYIYKS